MAWRAIALGYRPSSSRSPERAGSFAYVIDRSGSMATRNSLDVAKRELRASIAKLTPNVRFSVVFYNSASRSSPTCRDTRA